MKAVEYNIGFAERLIETCRFVRGEGTYDFEAAQVIAYLSFLSIELSLKAFLEQAGVSIKEIKKYSHNIDKLLDAVGKYEVELDLQDMRLEFKKFIPATRLRDTPVQGGKTVGELILKQVKEGSIYPNQIRYGTGFRSFGAGTLLALTSTVHQFVRENWVSVRLASEKKENQV